MKPLCILVAALLLTLCAGVSSAASPQLVQWRADLATTEVRNLYLRHGDSANLTARLYLRGDPYNPTNAVCYFQTNGMAHAWWSAPCSIASNVVTVSWSPLLDPGADLVSLVVRLDDSAYRAAAMLYLRPSPGAEPNVLPPPTQWLDFDKVAYTNAPWALPSDIPIPSTTDPLMDGTATSGGSAEYARADHVHPAETMSAVDQRNPSLPTSALPITFMQDEELCSARSEDIEFAAHGSGWTLFVSDHGICEFSSDGKFSYAWDQAEDLKFAGVSPVPGVFPTMKYAVSVRGVEVPTMDDLLAAEPGNYAAVSNAAMTALQSYTETDPTVPDWAKAANKPTYTASEVGAATPDAVAAAAMSATNYTDLAVAAAEPGNYAAVSNAAMTALQSYTETDPTVPDWAKAANKPTYTASEVGAATPDAVAAAAMSATNYTDLAVAAAEPGNYVAVSNAAMSAQAYTDNALANAGGGPALASNLVARVIAEAGESAAATEVLRIILADHQRRLDALEDADGTDGLTEAQAEAIVNAMCEAWATNTIIPARIAYQSAQALAVEAAATYQHAGNPMPLSTDEIAEISYTEADAVSIDVSPRRATRYYRSADASSNLSIASFAGANNNPSWLLLGGYGSVTWPSGSAYAGSAYPGTEGGVFRIFKLNSQIYIERVY